MTAQDNREKLKKEKEDKMKRKKKRQDLDDDDSDDADSCVVCADGGSDRVDLQRVSTRTYKNVQERSPR